MERTFDRVVEEWGRLDILVNNAGVLNEAPLEDLMDEDFEKSIDSNLRGTLVCTRAAVPHMIQQGSGRVISAVSMSTHIGAVGLTAYSASKGAIVSMTRTWARELGPKGITANAVAPGLIDSETTSTVPAGELEATLARLPARRLGAAGGGGRGLPLSGVGPGHVHQRSRGGGGRGLVSGLKERLEFRGHNTK